MANKPNPMDKINTLRGVHKAILGLDGDETPPDGQKPPETPAAAPSTEQENGTDLLNQKTEQNNEQQNVTTTGTEQGTEQGTGSGTGSVTQNTEQEQPAGSDKTGGKDRRTTRKRETDQQTGTSKRKRNTEPKTEQIDGTDKMNRENEQTNGTVIHNQQNEHGKEPGNGTGNQNSETVTDQGTDSGNRGPESEDEAGTVTGNLVPELESDPTYVFLKRLNEKKQTVEQTHTRDTFLIENDLLARLNRIAERKPKGFKKELMNMILRQAVEKIERMEGGNT